MIWQGAKCFKYFEQGLMKKYLQNYDSSTYVKHEHMQMEIRQSYRCQKTIKYKCTRKVGNERVNV